MKIRPLMLLCCALALPQFSTAQTGIVTVQASNLVNSSGQPISYRIDSKGQSIDSPVTAQVIGGAFTLSIADTSLTYPANVCFQVSVFSNTYARQSLLGPGYSCVQPAYSNTWCSAGVCNFDDYTPSGTPGALVEAPTLQIGSVASGQTPAASIVGPAPNYKLDLTLAAGSGPVGGLTPSTTLRQVTNRTELATMINTGPKSMLTRVWEMSYVPIHQIELGWANWYVDSQGSTHTEDGLGTTTTVAFAIEYPKGTCTTITWNGGSSTYVAPDDATSYTDLVTLPFTIPAFARFWIWTYASQPVAEMPIVWEFAPNTSMGDEGWYNSANVPCTQQASPETSWFLFPAVVLSYSNRPVVAEIGDSLTEGVNDLLQSPDGGSGLFGHALAQYVPQLNLGFPSDEGQWYVASHTLRNQLIAKAGATAVIDAYGRNDLDSGQTAVQLEATRATIQSYFNIPVFDTTITPYTFSTDNWQTAANQTPVSSTVNTQRVAFNDYMRSHQVGAGLIDVAQWLETSPSNENGPVLDGGVWIPRFMDSTGQGIHPSSFGYQDPYLERDIKSVIEQLLGGSTSD